MDLYATYEVSFKEAFDNHILMWMFVMFLVSFFQQMVLLVVVPTRYLRRTGNRLPVIKAAAATWRKGLWVAFFTLYITNVLFGWWYDAGFFSTLFTSQLIEPMIYAYIGHLFLSTFILNMGMPQQSQYTATRMPSNIPTSPPPPARKSLRGLDDPPT